MTAPNRAPLSLRRRAWNSGRAALLIARERGLPRWPPERIEQVQRRRLRSIVDFAHRTVPFYREAFAERGLKPADIRSAADLERLPLIDGRLVRERPEAFASSAFDDRSRETLFTSGTDSGVRRTIHWDDEHIVHTLATAERERAVLVRLTGETRGLTALRELVARGGPAGAASSHARVSIFPGDSSSRVMRVLWSERMLLPARAGHHHFLRPDTPFETIVERMNAIRPRLVFSFGSYAEGFFRELAHTGAEVHLPRVWAYTSDHMADDARRLAEERYGCAVYSIYSSIEAHRLALQCELRRGFHLNVDRVAVRVVRDDGRTAQPGEPGDIVISNLVNRATVLLNYGLGDRGVMAPGACPCGRTLPLLERFDGRRSETFAAADGRRVSSLELEGMLRSELREALRAQFVQRRPDELLVRVVPLTRLDEASVGAAIAARLAPLLGASTRISCEVVDQIPAAAGGKFRRALVP